MISGIILAAGRSVRMGQPKLLLNLQGRSLIRHVVENAVESRLDKVVVVVGNEAAKVRAEIERYDVQIVENPAFAEGQSMSLRAGLRAVDPKTQAVLVLMGDQPFVNSAIIDALVERYKQENCVLVVPDYVGQRGAPVLFDRSLFHELLAVSGDKGGRDIVKEHLHRACVVPIESGLAARDIDTWSDYQDVVATAGDANA
ncbi:MAG: molybdenum cofactor cytidylyltransferase [Dehalococcoidales bacterium]|nr:molybdenum cofactor cytidylyltransferase [Dehalococcoidales bacterium]